MDSSLLADLLAWCLAFFLPVLALAGPLRRDQGAAQAYLIVAFLHVAAAAVYLYVPGVLPTRGDAIVFHGTAAWAHMTADAPLGIGSTAFEWYLAHVYSWIGPSWFLGSVLSIWAFAFSVVVLVKFIDLLDVHHGKGLAVLLFGALPTAILYGSVPMREPYQVLFFMLACYFMLRFRLSSQPHHLVAAIVFALMMGLLHKGLIVYAPFLIVIMLSVRVDHHATRSLRGGSVNLHRLAAVALAIGFVVWTSGTVQKLQGISGTEVLQSAITGDGLFDFAEEHRDEEALSKGRTAYGVSLKTETPTAFVYSAMMILFYYIFTPFPWQIRNLIDVYAFGEVILRIVCLVAIFRMWRQGGPVNPRIVTLLMIVYFSMAFLWAAGTTNYGTATRHHMVHLWILLLLGIPALLKTLPGLGDRDRTSSGTAALELSGARGGHFEPRNSDPRSRVASSSAPRRLGNEAGRPRRLQTAPTASRLLSPDRVKPRRLADK